MPYSDKPVWKYMLREQVKKRINVHGHDAMLAAFPVHLIVIGNPVIMNIQNPGIGYGHAISIASDILKHHSDSFGRRL